MMKPRNKIKGFTLIELLVVISIIGFLSSIVLAAVVSARYKAIDIKVVSDFHQLQNALEMYRLDNGHFPYQCGFGPYSNCNFNNLGTPEYSFSEGSWLADLTISSPPYIWSLPTPPNIYEWNYYYLPVLSSGKFSDGTTPGCGGTRVSGYLLLIQDFGDIPGFVQRTPPLPRYGTFDSSGVFTPYIFDWYCIGGS